MVLQNDARVFDSAQNHDVEDGNGYVDDGGDDDDGDGDGGEIYEPCHNSM